MEKNSILFTQSRLTGKLLKSWVYDIEESIPALILHGYNFQSKYRTVKNSTTTKNLNYYENVSTSCFISYTLK